MHKIRLITEVLTLGVALICFDSEVCNELLLIKASFCLIARISCLFMQLNMESGTTIHYQLLTKQKRLKRVKSEKTDSWARKNLTDSIYQTNQRQTVVVVYSKANIPGPI